MRGESKNEGLLTGGAPHSAHEKCRPPSPGGHPEAETAAFLAAIIESSRDAIISKDLDGVITSWNRGAEDIFGYGAAEMIGRPVSILIPPDRMGEEAHILDCIRRGERVEPYETVRCRKDGATVDISLTVSPIRNQSGTIIGASKIARDISEQHRDQERLRSSEARKTAILDSALDCIVTINHEGCVTEFNSAAERTFGYRRDEVVGKHLADVMIPPSIREQHRRGFARYLATGEPRMLGRRMEMTAIRADGSEFPVDLAITRIPLEGPPSFTGCLRDITERKRTESLLENQKRVLEMMAAGAPLSDSLAALTSLIEAQFPGILCSILLLNPHTARLHFGAAPSLPPEYVAAMEGLLIGPAACSCGTAAYRKEPVLVEDIATDPRWKDYRAVALQHGLRACWSTPIFDSQRQIIGTFAMFYRQPGLPQPEHWRLIEMATHVAAIAVCGHRVQAVLRASEARLKEAQRLAKIGYWERDLLTDHITWSEETYRIWGQPKDLVVAQANLQEMIHPDDRSLQTEALREVLEKGRKYDVEYRIIRPNGEIRFLHAWDEIERDESGRPVRLFGTVQDITERKQAELLLHAQAQEIRTIVENSPDLIVRFDRQSRRTFVNAAFIRANGLPEEKLLGREIASAAKDGAVNATAEEIATLEASLKQAFETRRPLDFECTWPLTTGRRTFAVHFEPEFDDRGALTSILGISRDITERKRAEEAVRESQQLLHLVLATLPVGVAVTDRAGDILLANAASKRVWGGMIVSGSERWAQSKGFWHDSGKRIAPANWASVRAISEGQTSLNELIDIETHDGQKKTIQNSAAPIRNAEGLIVGAVIVNEDVTARVCAEEALKKAEDNLRFVLDTTPAMIHTARPDGYLDYFNQRWLDYVGLPLEGLQGWAWTSVVHAEDIEREVSRWRACIASGEPFECEVRMRRADGKYRWALHRKVAMRDELGNIVKWCGSGIDIDDRKQAEQKLRESHAQLRALTARLQSVREEEATRIAREIHDDLGQKLTGLKMDLLRAERLLEGLETSPTINSILGSIVAATELADGFTAGIQQIAADLRPSVLDQLGLAPALQYEARAFERRAGIHCEVRLPETEVVLSSEHATALFRIFQEALTNVARHAHARKVEVELGVEAGSVILSVQDDGRGITEADIARPESLGLLGMKERAELLAGDITFQPNSNQQGTVVRVRIPQMGGPVLCGC